MAKEINFTGHLAIGNGEPCPFCAAEGNRLVEDIFINSEDNDIMEHIMNEHPSELNKALFSDPPPKPWLEQDFQLVIAKVSVQIKFLEEIRPNLIPHEELEERMQNMYSVMKDYFNNESK